MATKLKPNPFDYLDQESLVDFRFYFKKINEMFDYQAGVREIFEETPGVTSSSDFAQPSLTMDDRYNYAARDIFGNEEMSPANQVLNAFLTHIYGGYECPRVFSGQIERKKGWVDFERIAAKDYEYVETIKRNMEKSRALGYNMWSKWGLRVSVQNEGNKFCLKNDREPGSHACLEWMADWIEDGTIDRLLNAQAFSEATEILLEKRGIGPYIGLHSSSILTVAPNIKVSHTEPYVLAGPGAVQTIKRLFPGMKGWKHNDVCVWFTENQDELLGEERLHPHWHNVIVNGTEVYSEPQDRLYAITSEIALCQYGAFDRARANPAVNERRRKGFMSPDPVLEQMQSLVPI